MEVKYELVEENEMLEKIKEEIEVLESIYDGENIVLRAPEIVQNEKAVNDFTQFQSGEAQEFEF